MGKKTARVTTPTPDETLKRLRWFWVNYGAIIVKYGSVPVSTNDFGVGGSTFRAYGRFVPGKKGKKKHKPTRIVKDWLDKELPKCKLATTKVFAKFHRRARESLSRYWKLSTKSKLPTFPYASKVVDLHVKHVIWHDRRLPEWRKRQLRRSAFQPLDRYSLELLRHLKVSLPKGKPIPSQATMGAIRNGPNYIHLQMQIRKICSKAKVPPFAFDQFAWKQIWKVQ
jgi:hypothetical protein